MLYINMMCSGKFAYAEEECKMAINLETALKIARKNPGKYEIRHGDGFTNIIRKTEEASGKYTARKQIFDSKTGNLKETERRINDNYSIYSNPTNGIFGLQYFTKVNNPNASMGYDLKRVYVETTPKSVGDIKAFYKSQESNMH